MGAHPYWYFTPYDSDVDAALQKLRRREFEAGRYSPAMFFPEFPVDPAKPSPGAQHASIDEAREAADADGTRSILDVDEVSDEPGFCATTRLDDDRLKALYDTTQPTREMLEANMDFFEDVDRGCSIYIVVHRDGRPHELLFAGYSFD